MKCGRPGALAGLEAFRRAHPGARALVIGSGGIELEEYFGTDPASLFR